MEDILHQLITQQLTSQLPQILEQVTNKKSPLTFRESLTQLFSFSKFDLNQFVFNLSMRRIPLQRFKIVDEPGDSRPSCCYGYSKYGHPFVQRRPFVFRFVLVCVGWPRPCHPSLLTALERLCDLRALQNLVVISH